MAIDKIGEQQVTKFFSAFLENEIKREFGHIEYLIGDFAGKHDKEFADFFAGVNAFNILIEFKEFENEISAEKKKDLRKELCTGCSRHRI